ncbi:MAG TPA: archaemetzincin [Planctomycetaceae bacterium]
MKSLPRFSRREVLALSSLPAVGILGWGLHKIAGSWTDDSGDDWFSDPSRIRLPDKPEFHRFQRLAYALAPLYSKLPAPQSDEWLAKHAEEGQTFARFVFERPERLSDRYRRIALVPLGDLTATQRLLLADMADFLEMFLGFPVELLSPVSLADLPEHAQRVRESGGRQVRTSYLLNEMLLPLCEDDMAAVVALTSSDLWDGDFGFLFGQGSHPQRVCVCSVARFGDVDSGEVDYATCLRRTAGLAVHETGHVFGMPHCIAWSCRMNGSNNLAESDRRPLEYCPECLPKIWWTCAMDPAQRFSRLLEFAHEHRLDAEAKLWQAAGALLAAVEGR